MVVLGKCLCLLILVSLILVAEPKSYQFQVTYECENDEYRWLYQKITNETVYGCKNWVQKILISEKKNEYIRFESAQKQQQQKIQQDEQKDFQQQEKKEETQQELLKEEQEEKELEEIQQLKEQQNQMNKEKLNQQNKQKVYSSTTISTSNTENKQQSSNTSIQSSTVTQKHPHLLTLNHHYKYTRKLMQDHNGQLTHKLANIFHKLVLPNNIHKLKSYYYTQQDQNQIRHYFELRHNQQQKQQGQQEKFKPIKVHRSHPIEDVMFLLELIEMNSIILESTYHVRQEDIPTLQELQRRLPKPIKQQGKSQAQTQTQKSQKIVKQQQKQHSLLNITNTHYLRQENI